MWIKICANTNLEDTQLAIDLGADAVGFVFAPSTRRVTPQQVGYINSRLLFNGRSVERIGVFQGSSFEAIRDAVAIAHLTGVQLHDAPSPSLIAALYREFRGAITLAQTLHWPLGASTQRIVTALATQVEALCEARQINRILVDTKAGGALGGTGIPFNWGAASELFQNAEGVPMVVAGGLNPQNVVEAVKKLHPWGVDVASGVEDTAGRKDPEQLRCFINKTRNPYNTRQS